MIEKGIIEAHLKEITEGTGVFIVDVRVDKNNRILVNVDREEGISIDDCVEISRALEGKLDRDEEDFALEVSSPGIDAPFKVIEQYIKNTGKTIILQLKDDVNITGVLKGIKEKGIVIAPVPGQQEELPGQLELAFEEIVSARLRVQF